MNTAVEGFILFIALIVIAQSVRTSASHHAQPAVCIEQWMPVRGVRCLVCIEHRMPLRGVHLVCVLLLQVRSFARAYFLMPLIFFLAALRHVFFDLRQVSTGYID